MTISVAPIGKLTRCVADRFQIATGFRQPQQRQTIVGVTGTQPFERAFRARQRGLQHIRFDAVRADVVLARIVDGLKDAHAVICLESRAGRNENNATAIP